LTFSGLANDPRDDPRLGIVRKRIMTTSLFRGFLFVFKARRMVLDE
jgi:hypothetical protein